MSLGRKRLENTTQNVVDQSAHGKPSSWFWKFIYAEPSMIVQSIWDAFDAWWATRNWRALFWFTPAFLVLVVCFGTILWGMTRSKADLRDRYLQLAEQEAPIIVGPAAKISKNSGGQPTDKENKTGESESDTDEKGGVHFSEYADLLYRRVLQLESNNVRARYYVAYRVGAAGNVVQARGMMKELAPDNAKGFEPAHAWMAMDMVQRFGRGELDERSKEALIHHLAIASTWEQVDVNLLLIYSGVLESQGKIDEAIQVCRKAASRDSTLHLALAEICARAKYTTQANDEAAIAIRVYSKNFGTDLEKDVDRVGAARAHLIRNEPDKAIKLLVEGLQFKPDRPIVKRTLSEVLRLKYRASFRQTANGVELNMNFLESAAKVDPGNPAVGEEIAQLSQLGVTASDNTIDALRKQLASGTASAITHALLGNAFASRKLWDRAIIHWELALGQNPDLVLVLNNLAVALTEQDATNASRGLEMIDKALQVAGRDDAELFDSRAQILLAAGRDQEAITWFEKALSIDANRVGTREGIIKAAKAAGFTDLVDIHSKALTELNDRIAKEAEKKKQPVPAPISNSPAPDIPSEAKILESTQIEASQADISPAADPPLERVNAPSSPK